ncbi:MAG TPA: hypothetical protein VHY34_07835 [Caulobacteraceae bacterium]|nr:hypothetical protein [Caulobacteraceae bacterium]
MSRKSAIMAFAFSGVFAPHRRDDDALRPESDRTIDRNDPAEQVEESRRAADLRLSRPA